MQSQSFITHCQKIACERYGASHYIAYIAQHGFRADSLPSGKLCVCSPVLCPQHPEADVELVEIIECNWQAVRNWLGY